MDIEEESNRFLVSSNSAILKRKELFQTQVRALLVHLNMGIWLLFPMISSIEIERRGKLMWQMP
ncbi:MAG: hypothetical protein ACLVJO_01540 [[Clostridium] scindens]